VQTFEQFRGAAERLRAYRVADAALPPAFRFEPAPRRQQEHRPLKPVATASASERLAARGIPTLLSAAQGIARGAISAVELMRDAYAAVASWNASVNAFEYLLPEDEALRHAAEKDRLRAQGAAVSPLWGVPITVKDVIHVAGMPTTASSRTLDGFVPPEDAEAVALLRAAGAIVIGKTTCHEFALGVTTPQSRNPWDTGRDPGGSSGGSAIAVATGMGLASLGTDTRASIRVPAALCGVVGFKPTYGLVATRGVVTLSWSMDHVAPIARTTEDVAALFNVLLGQFPPAWPPPSLTLPRKGGGDQPIPPPTDYRQFCNVDVAGLRVGIPVEGLRGVEPGVLAVWEQAVGALRNAGVALVDVPEPTVGDFEMANAAGLIVSRCEALAYHHSLLPGGDDRYTRDVAEQLTEAATIPATDYLQAQRFRAEFLERMARLLASVDALAMPTCRVTAPRSEDVEQYFLVLSANCIPWSFIGFPAISVPCGLTLERLPVGIQLVGAPFDEGTLLSLGSAIEARLDMPILPAPTL